MFILTPTIIVLLCNLATIFRKNLQADVGPAQYMRNKTYLATILCLSLTVTWISESFFVLLSKRDLGVILSLGIMHLVCMIILYKIHCKYRIILQNDSKIADQQ